MFLLKAFRKRKIPSDISPQGKKQKTQKTKNNMSSEKPQAGERKTTIVDYILREIMPGAILNI